MLAVLSYNEILPTKRELAVNSSERLTLPDNLHSGRTKSGAFNMV